MWSHIIRFYITIATSSSTADCAEIGVWLSSFPLVTLFSQCPSSVVVLRYIPLADRLRKPWKCAESKYNIITIIWFRQSLLRQPWEQPEYPPRYTTGVYLNIMTIHVVKTAYNRAACRWNQPVISATPGRPRRYVFNMSKEAWHWRIRPQRFLVQERRTAFCTQLWTFSCSYFWRFWNSDSVPFFIPRNTPLILMPVYVLFFYIT